MSGRDGARWRWKVARWLDDHTSRCWADLVTWALGWTRFGEINTEASCVTDSERDGRCYCGKYENGCLRTPERAS